MKNLLLLFTSLLSLSLSQHALANERIRPRNILLQEGYKEVQQHSLQSLSPMDEPAAHSLNWPVKFQDSEHSLANAMAEFQPFGSPYFHGGCDLRVEAAANIIAPVSGKLEAGHYSYNQNADGSLTKFWKPWPQEGDPNYFEVAVVAPSGIRYEFHHTNSSTLPDTIVKMLNEGGGQVEKGTLLGHAIYWPDGDYHHIHYNVILPDGTRMNPEYVSPLVEDHVAPTVSGAYAVLANGKTIDFQHQKLLERPSYFAVAVIDKNDKNVYEHPASFAQILFQNGASFEWDFRKTLTTKTGSFPRLWDFFVRSLTTPTGEVLETDGGYGLGLSIIRLNLPFNAKGPFTITISDIAGNSTLITGEL